MQDQTSTVSFSPSFSAYSSNHHLAQIATRVAGQEPHPQNIDDFEFVQVRTHPDDTTAGGPTAFPLFNRDLQLDLDDDAAVASPERESIDGGGGSPSSSSSSSEGDELEGVPDGTYCVWVPKSPSPSPARCKKSNSTGSSSSSASQSKRHRWLPLRDLLRRCRSDGKQSLVFLDHPSNRRSEIFINGGKSKKREEDPKEDGKKGASKTVSTKGKTVSAHEVFYIRKKRDDGHGRKSYLPYRQDLVGFFSNPSANGMGRSFSPF